MRHYVVMKLRALKRQKQQAVALPQKDGLGRKLRDNLAFKLTDAQRRVIRETLTDLEKRHTHVATRPGDVGSGKTIVAAFAAIRAIEAAKLPSWHPRAVGGTTSAQFSTVARTAGHSGGLTHRTNN